MKINPYLLLGILFVAGIIGSFGLGYHVGEFMVRARVKHLMDQAHDEYLEEVFGGE